MHNEKVALVTGANKGIGLQIAKDLTAKGITVLVGSRSINNGKAAAKAIGGNARALELDVTNPTSIRRAADYIEKELGRLDILVNNAGISNTMPLGTPFNDVIAAGQPDKASLEEIKAIFEVNVFGVIAVIQTMLPLLSKAPSPRIVIVSSSVGSLAYQTDPKNPHPIRSVGYLPSKTAINSVTINFAAFLASTNPKIKVNAVCPGFVATDLNAFQGTRTVEEGARAAVRMSLLDDDGPTGTFTNEEGVVPW
jgi:NAD(P)-dependent dehydrogenase (short-subunit alcohol dehydrogenase family)